MLQKDRIFFQFYLKIKKHFGWLDVACFPLQICKKIILKQMVFCLFDIQQVGFVQSCETDIKIQPKNKSKKPFSEVNVCQRCSCRKGAGGECLMKNSLLVELCIVSELYAMISLIHTFLIRNSLLRSSLVFSFQFFSHVPSWGLSNVALLSLINMFKHENLLVLTHLSGWQV